MALPDSSSCVRCPQVLGVDGAEVFTGGGLDIALVYQVCDAAQQLALLIHIRRIEHGACEHKLDV